MTHDELLAKIDEEGEFLVQYFDSKPIVHSALRAVVQLHKPQEITLPDGEWGENCGGCDIGFTYPCPTIQIIEKTLG